MLNRLRNIVKRLELPEDERDVVYRIIDEDRHSVEVTPAQYGLWRMQNDVAQKAVVAHDTLENVQIWTTFSIMPDDRNYRPFGTHAFHVTLMEPLPDYSNRYDTWGEAELGHAATLEQIRRDYARFRAAEERAAALAGTIGEVRLAISAGVPALFRADERSDNEVTVSTPLSWADGSPVELLVAARGTGFVLSVPMESISNDSADAPENLFPEPVAALLSALGVELESGTLTCRVEDSSQLGRGIIRAAQAAVCLSYITPGSPGR